MSRGCVLTILALTVAPLAHADEPATQRLHIGNTGIQCFKQPCPHRGVFVAGAAGEARMIYADLYGDSAPPPMIATEEGRSAVVEAWADYRCIAVEGVILEGNEQPPTIRIRRIIGSCESD